MAARSRAGLADSGKVTRGWLGVGIQPVTPELARSFGRTETTGALVSSVFEPVEFLEKLAALTPRPEINLVLYLRSSIIQFGWGGT